MEKDKLIKVMLEDAEGGGIIEFNSSEVLKHNQIQTNWCDLSDLEQTSLAEDYALWSAKRKYGDLCDYRVDVISLGDEDGSSLGFS